MSVATSLSRVTGFARTWFTAYALGVGTFASAYHVANNVPNMIFEFVAGGILSSLFIPTFLELREQRSEPEAWRFASHVFNLSLLALGSVAVLGTVFPQPFMWTQTFLMPAARPADVQKLAEFFFRFFAVQVAVYGGGMVIQGLLNARRRYLWTALGPVFNNIVVIVTMIVVASIGAETKLGMIVLASGTTLGVLAMFLVMLPDLKKSGIRYTPELGLSDPAVRRMLKLAIPTVVYVATNIVAVSFRNATAFRVSDRGPSILMYAWNFSQLPSGILAVALATAVFTELSESSGRNDMDAFKRHLSSGLRMTGVLILPSAAVLIALAEPLVSLYRAGAFQAENVPVVADVLRWWAIGVTLFAAMMFLLRSFYSLKDTATPAYLNLALTPLQIGGYFIFTTGVLGWTGAGIRGIPMGDVFFYATMVVALSVALHRKIGGYRAASIVAMYGKMLVAAAVGGVAAYYIGTAVTSAIPGLSGSLLAVTAGAVACFAIALGIGSLLGVDEVRGLGALVRRIGARLGGRS